MFFAIANGVCLRAQLCPASARRNRWQMAQAAEKRPDNRGLQNINGI